MLFVNKKQTFSNYLCVDIHKKHTTQSKHNHNFAQIFYSCDHFTHEMVFEHKISFLMYAKENFCSSLR